MTAEVPFSELLSVVIDNRGKTCPTTNVGIPLIATNCIRNELLYPTYDKVRFVSNETYRNWFRAHPLPGDIIFVNKATPGRVCLVPDPVDFCIAQDMVAVRADPKRVYPKYLFAVLRSPAIQEKIGQMHVGTLIPHFKKGDFDKLLLPIPEPEEQRLIGDIYFELSAKIEANGRMNATLQAIARALFQSWFVDFDPVRSKLEGRKPVGLDDRTAAYFPDTFEDSPIGPIPHGWRVKDLGELADFDKGLSYKGEGLADEGGMPMVNLGCFSGRGLFNPDRIKRYTGEYRERHLVHVGDLVIANTDMTQNRVIIGSPALIPDLNGKKEFLFTHHVFAARFKPGEEVWRRYVFFTLLKPEFREIAEGFSTGTTVLALPRDGLMNYSLCLPSIPLLEAFEKQLRPLLAAVDANFHQSRTLATLRDTLLPKLLSGEVRTSEQ